MKSVIRTLSITDYDATLALWRRCEGLCVGEGDSREEIRRFLRRNRGLSLVAEVDGQIIGAALCGHDGRRGFIYHLAVAPGHRRNGTGARLVSACLRGLRACGLRKFHIVVFAHNRAGQEFWRRIGWTKRRDLQLMSRNLPA
ncbi:MAG: GNAT family N-acetyltransferase [Limisphaerales bacterium]